MPPAAQMFVADTAPAICACRLLLITVTLASVCAAEVDNSRSSHDHSARLRPWHLSYNSLNDGDGAAVVGVYVVKLPFTDDEKARSSITQVVRPPPAP